MPAPIASDMQRLAADHFRSLGITLPMDWTAPDSEEAKEQYQASFAEDDYEGHEPGSDALFKAASSNKLHVDTVEEISEKVRSFMDGACAAICSAWSTWQKAATLSGVVIAGPVATLGVVAGPPLKPLILAEAPKSNPTEIKYSKAVADAVDGGWTPYVSSIKIPGLPWYPLFAAVPSPVAPPTPNTPVPVSALTQVTVSLKAQLLKASMVAALGDSGAQHHAAIFESIATAFEACFNKWQTQTMVTNVLGTGPVPLLGGPVAGGTATMPPGGFK